MTAWRERVEGLEKSLGRAPSLKELLELSKSHVMTPEEKRDQQESWVRGMTARCEHGIADFEQCGECRGR